MTRKSWTDGPMCSWDTETTGVNVETARIVTSATAIIRPGEPPQTAEWLVDPGIEIPEQATRVHGITTEQARTEGGEAAAAAEMIVETLLAELSLNVPLVVFNAPYDLTLLDRECRRHGLKTLTDRLAETGTPLFVIDPLVLDKAVAPRRKGKRTLARAAEVYGVDFGAEGAHSASGDCLGAARVAWRIGRAYSEVGTLSLEQLMRFQAEAHAEWAEGFEQYLREKKNEPDASISRDWPIIPAEATA